jgi:peptidoglycan/LPS O-acetylase OafA/YrhL
MDSPERGRPAGGSSGGRLPYRADIEGMRAVAILMVVFYHAGWQSFGGGFFGVDAFFVLSGFLITGIVVDEIENTGTLSLTNFWARRARRLLPAAAVLTIFVLVADVVVRVSPFVQIWIADSARAFAVYGSNVLYAIRSTDYFGRLATRDPLLHTWSLSVEEQFYLFFAPLLLASAVWARKLGAERFRYRLTWVGGLLTVLSFVGCLLLVRRYPVIAFYVLPPRAWEFGLGALSYLLVRRGPALGAATREVLAALGLGALVIAAMLLRDDRVSPLGPASVVPTLGTATLLVCGASAYRTRAAGLLSTAPMRVIGRLSYSWYLWHWPFMVYLREREREPSLPLSLAVALLSLVPATITYYAVERPIRFSPRLARRTIPVLAAAVVLAVVTWAGAGTARRYANGIVSSPKLAPVLAARAMPRIYADGCQLQLLETESPPCEYGPARNDTTVVLFGDSHAAHWFPALDSVATLRGWKLVNLTKTGCPATMVTVTNLGRRYFECDAWREHALRRIVRLRPTLIVFSNDKTYHLFVGETLLFADSSVAALREWRRGLARTVGALRASGARIAMVADTPQPSGDVPQCLLKYGGDSPRCDSRPEESINALTAASERISVREIHGVEYIDLTDRICEPTVCPTVRNGIVRYSDSNHLSVQFAASLAPALSVALTGALASE